MKKSISNGPKPARMTELTEDRVTLYLKTNPNYLESFVSTHISKETLLKWSARKSMKERKESKKGIIGAWINPDLSTRRRLIQEQGDNQARMLFELAQCCGQLFSTDAIEVHLMTEEGTFAINKGTDGNIKQKRVKKSKHTPNYIQKVIDPSEHTLGEIHFNSPLDGQNQQIVNIFSTFAASSLYYSTISHQLTVHGENFDVFARQRKLSNFLLDVAKSMFQDIISMDTVIMKVMNFAQKLVNADRASLFLVDQKNKELHARIFDVGMGTDEFVRMNSLGQKEIRFSMSKGISGHVATTGEGLNIENAYEDERFNEDVDQQTGYKTKSILCMPIFIRKTVIGVVQMINKLDGVFTRADEDAFSVFAVYCGLALHHAKLYDKIRRSENRHRVAMEVLAYHSVCHRDEVAKLRKIEKTDNIPELETFDFNSMRLSELEKPVYAVYMFNALFKDLIKGDSDDVARFVLTVRKNYRKVPYHNWAHGWSVGHAMFVLLLKTKEIFKAHEALALYVSCLCHDLDHRGKNNAYMKSMSTSLAALYTTSVMEHHHFNQTISILQQEGHDVLQLVSPAEYKDVLMMIKHCILATDLALFFKNKDELGAIVKSGKYDIENAKHRRLTQAILMTGCDLIASAKPWEVQSDTVKVIFEEFYQQGDEEKRKGQSPIAMMDRDKRDDLPQMQVGFMRGICLPCYDLIAQVIPAASILRDRCEYNAKMWEKLAEEEKQKQEHRKAMREIEEGTTKL